LLHDLFLCCTPFLTHLHVRLVSLGFDEVAKRHFTLCRKRVLAQARLWTAEARGTPLYNGFVHAYEELLTLLSSDELVRHKAPGQTEEQVWGSVPLHNEDFRGLEERDPAFVQVHQRTFQRLVVEVDKASASDHSENSQAMAMDTSTEHPATQASPSNTNPTMLPETYNPWANGATGAASALGQEEQTGIGGEEEDDFEDLYA
jgi:hypothetical protein